MSLRRDVYLLTERTARRVLGAAGEVESAGKLGRLPARVLSPSPVGSVLVRVTSVTPDADGNFPAVVTWWSESDDDWVDADNPCVLKMADGSTPTDEQRYLAKPSAKESAGTIAYVTAPGASSAAGGSITTLYNEGTQANVTNTTTETTLLSGSPTFTSAALATRSAVRLTMGGRISTDTTVLDSITLRLKMGSTIIGELAFSSLPINMTSVAWSLDIMSTLRTLGSPGTCAYVAHGLLNLPVSTSFISFPVKTDNTTPTTTGNPSLNVTAQWSAARSNDAFVLYTLLVELIDPP